MPTLKRSTWFALCCSTVLLLGCAKSDNQAVDTLAADAAEVAPAPAPLTAADFAGKWDMRAIPVSGDTTPTIYVMTATSGNNGWTFTFRNRPPVPVRITFDGDSLMTEAGPYQSVRRPSLQVRTNGVFRIADGNIVGTSVAHFATKAADSVLTLSVTGSRAK